jgi:hypothetical protein
MRGFIREIKRRIDPSLFSFFKSHIYVLLSEKINRLNLQIVFVFLFVVALTLYTRIFNIVRYSRD